jgi:hypothetical protein
MRITNFAFVSHAMNDAGAPFYEQLPDIRTSDFKSRDYQSGCRFHYHSIGSRPNVNENVAYFEHYSDFRCLAYSLNI